MKEEMNVLSIEQMEKYQELKIELKEAEKEEAYYKRKLDKLEKHLAYLKSKQKTENK